MAKEGKQPIHIPVMLNEVLEHFAPKPGDSYIDCTAGEGGHSIAIAKMVIPEGKVLSIEADPEELQVFKSRVEDSGLQTIISTVNGNFRNVKQLAEQAGFENVDGVLFDLGFSSWQLEKSGRGFTFQKEEIMDMRFDSNDDSRPKAADILNLASKKHLEWIFSEYGEERHAKRIAKAVVERRKKNHFQTTGDFIEAVESVVKRRGKIHPATRVFQALRIAVNGEFDNIKEGLANAVNIVKSDGKIAVITFHSLEDRIVKNIFRSWVREEGLGELVNKNVIIPSEEEINKNPRARSAKLRVFKKS
ncbi:MAG: 16S rRNA (cytosine(1402)-N(4))-methyltransferase RsmH [Candidatus Spechtbacterales bacterium]|nr:16S rRNA (cytosine(1402)-N(4))-methyltransferase RsmH [Candidatus Spechtbacterales bacterium]